MVRFGICIWDVFGFTVGRLPIIFNKNFRGLSQSILANCRSVRRSFTTVSFLSLSSSSTIDVSKSILLLYLTSECIYL